VISCTKSAFPCNVNIVVYVVRTPSTGKLEAWFISSSPNRFESVIERSSSFPSIAIQITGILRLLSSLLRQPFKSSRSLHWFVPFPSRQDIDYSILNSRKPMQSFNMPRRLIVTSRSGFLVRVFGCNKRQLVRWHCFNVSTRDQYCKPPDFIVHCISYDLTESMDTMCKTFRWNSWIFRDGKLV